MTYILHYIHTALVLLILGVSIRILYLETNKPIIAKFEYRENTILFDKNLIYKNCILILTNKFF